MSACYKRSALVAAASVMLMIAGCGKPPAQPESAATPAPALPKIGGADVVQLKRAATSNGAKPEFLSATILPGRGMSFFQVTANIPGKGEIPLLASPSLDQAASTLTGAGADENGNGVFGFGGAFLVNPGLSNPNL